MPGERAQSPFSRRRLLAGCCLAMVVFAASVMVPGVCIEAIGSEFQLDLGGRGLVASFRQVALLAALLISGCLAERLGKRRFLTSGMFLIAAGMFSTVLARHYHSLLAAQVLVGIGSGAIEALVNPLVIELYPDSPARPLNITNGLFSVGLVIAALLAGEVLELGGPWRMAFQTWALPAVAVGVLFATRRYPRADSSTNADPSSPAGTGMAFLRAPLFWLFMCAMVIAGGCEAGMTFWSASFMEHEFGASARGGAMTVAFFGGAMALGRFASGGLVTRIGPLRLTVASALACAVATGALPFVGSTQAALVFFGLGGLFVACFWPTILAIASERVQAGSTTMFALLAAAGISGCALFPWAIGALGDLAGLRAGVAILPVAMVAQALLLLLGARRH